MRALSYRLDLKIETEAEMQPPVMLTTSITAQPRRGYEWPCLAFNSGHSGSPLSIASGTGPENRRRGVLSQIWCGCEYWATGHRPRSFSFSKGSSVNGLHHCGNDITREFISAVRLLIKLDADTNARDKVLFNPTPYGYRKSESPHLACSKLRA